MTMDIFILVPTENLLSPFILHHVRVRYIGNSRVES